MKLQYLCYKLYLHVSPPNFCSASFFYRCYRLLAKILPNKWVVRFVGL